MIFASGLLEQVVRSILSPLPRTLKGNQCVIVLTDRFSKLTRAVPTRKIALLERAPYFLGSPLRHPCLSDRQCSATYEQAVFNAMDHFAVKQLTTTIYHPQINGQTDQ